MERFELTFLRTNAAKLIIAKFGVPVFSCTAATVCLELQGWFQ